MDTPATDFLMGVIGEDGTVLPDRLAERLNISKTQLATAIGLPKDAVTRQSRLHAPETQARLRDIVEILNMVQGWAGSKEAAFAWYRSAPLPSFGDMTSEDLVRQGRAEVVKGHIGRIAAGGFA